MGENNFGTISNSYNTGAVTGTNNVGGVVGENNGGTITTSFNAGAVSGTTNVGGLVGIDDPGTFTNNFWDTQTSGQSTSAGGTGKTTAQMKTQSTFTGWDFTTIWKMNSDSYPCLQAFADCLNPAPIIIIPGPDAPPFPFTPPPGFNSIPIAFTPGVGTNLIFSNGSSVNFSAGAGDSAIITPLGFTNLPGAVPTGAIFFSSLMISVMSGGANVSTLPGGATMQVSFAVPVGFSGVTFKLKFWDGSSWVDVPFTIVDGVATATVNFTGTFALFAQ
ncbi:MAG: hypothetical protein HY257_01785 [Chloroflexi bacterium]|nr:hypothetical protein [Chloroflexota bacterium]